MAKYEAKTKPSSVSPTEYLASLDEKRRADGEAVLGLFEQATGEPGVVWGSSIIGFGQVHYKYDSGHEGDTAKVGFSPRKSAISLYGLQGWPGSAELLARLGTFTLGKGCVYVKKLADVDQEVLAQLVRRGYENSGGYDKASGR